MVRADVAPILAKDFVLLKIDQDRMTGGGDILAAERTAVGVDSQGGIPWIAFCDASGTIMAHSDTVDPKDPKQRLTNIGFPSEDFEIAQFVAMLNASRANITPADIEMLRKSLVDEHDKTEAARAKAKAAAGASGGQ